MFRNFKSMAKTQSGQKLKVLRTDNGGEYTLKEFNAFRQEDCTPADSSILSTAEWSF